MTKKEILHTLIGGMDAYLSCGVPTPYWDLAVKLTREIYGDEGVEFLDMAHKINNNVIDANTEVTLHYIYGWTDDGNHEITPTDIVNMLKSLEK